MIQEHIKKIIIASHNPGKVREIQDLLAPLGIEIVTATDLGLEEPEETGSTFLENSQIKAVEIAKGGQLPALADDSGLVIPALDNQPGVYSARWAEVTPGGRRDFNIAMQKIEALLDGQEPTHAFMVCVLTLAFPDGTSHSFCGRIAGNIVFPGRGGSGFGYDPIFQPEGYNHTFAEMDPEFKHSISHRAQAFNQFVAKLKPAQ